MAKKKKRRDRRPGGPDPQELRQQRLEARREAKAREMAERRRRMQRERLVRLVSIVAIAGLVFWFIFLRDRAPTEINGNAIETLSVSGLNEHTRETIPYETSPPVSGPHAPNTVPCGIHGQPIQNEVQVHMLEHGAVGVQYRPDLDMAEIRSIEEIVDGYDSHVFSAPYPEMETPIAVTSWARIMRLDELDEDAIAQYVDRFRDRGPEANQPCPMDVNQPYEPPEADDAAEPTPAPGETTPAAEEDEDEGGG